MTAVPSVESTVRRLCLLLANPNWMPKPRSWIWARPDGMAQGFGPSWQENPGRANLLWLSLALGSPPHTYNANDNTLYMSLLLLGDKARLRGEPLFDMAALYSLKDFHDMLPSTVGGGPLENHYPLLKLLAKGRLHANS
jgi:hypothetical protein